MSPSESTVDSPKAARSESYRCGKVVIGTLGKVVESEKFY